MVAGLHKEQDEDWLYSAEASRSDVGRSESRRGDELQARQRGEKLGRPRHYLADSIPIIII